MRLCCSFCTHAFRKMERVPRLCLLPGTVLYQVNPRRHIQPPVRCLLQASDSAAFSFLWAAGRDLGSRSSRAPLAMTRDLADLRLGATCSISIMRSILHKGWWQGHCIFIKNQTLWRECSINPIQDGHFWGCSWMGRQKSPIPKICHTYPTMMKTGTVISYLKRIWKIYESRDTPLESSWNQQLLWCSEIHI